MPPLAVRAAKAMVNRRLRVEPHRRPGRRASGLLRPVLDRGSDRGHGRLHREARADLARTMRRTSVIDETAGRRMRAAPTTATISAVTLATARRRRTAIRRLMCSLRSTPTRRSAATSRRPSTRRRAVARARNTTGMLPAALLIPLIRPTGTVGVRLADVNRSALALNPSSHTLPLLGDGPCGLPVVYAIPAAGFDVVVNGEHLVSWGVEPAEIDAAAMANLAAWSVGADWTAEESGDRRLVSSDYRRRSRCRPDPAARSPGPPRRDPRRRPRSSSACLIGICSWPGSRVATKPSSRPSWPASLPIMPMVPTSRSTGACSSWSTASSGRRPADREMAQAFTALRWELDSGRRHDHPRSSGCPEQPGGRPQGGPPRRAARGRGAIQPSGSSC